MRFRPNQVPLAPVSARIQPPFEEHVGVERTWVGSEGNVLFEQNGSDIPVSPAALKHQSLTFDIFHFLWLCVESKLACVENTK